MNPDGTFTCYKPTQAKDIPLNQICYKGTEKARICGCVECVWDRHARVAVIHPLLTKKESSHSFSNPDDVLEDLKSLRKELWMKLVDINKSIEILEGSG
jgi:hypothetical protein